MLRSFAASVIPVEGVAAVSTIRISLPKDAASATESRHQVQRFAVDNQMVGRVGTALLVVSELVTNAVLYGVEPIEVRVTRVADVLRIEVSDAGSGADRIALQAHDLERVGGRGLSIVNALARGWGVQPGRDGKTVWAEVELDAAASNAFDRNVDGGR